MDDLAAIELVEGITEPTGTPEEQKAQVIAAWQRLIDSGVVWTLQGWYGRNAMDLIEQGICHPATKTG